MEMHVENLKSNAKAIITDASVNCLSEGINNASGERTLSLLAEALFWFGIVDASVIARHASMNNSAFSSPSLTRGYLVAAEDRLIRRINACMNFDFLLPKLSDTIRVGLDLWHTAWYETKTGVSTKSDVGKWHRNFTSA